MKSVYLAAAVIVTGLALSPYVLLEQEAPARFAGSVVVYDIYGAKIDSIDPATCGDVPSSLIQGNFYEGLYTYHYLKRPLEVIPQLAAGPPRISRDGLVYTIPLRKGVRYSRNPCFGVDADGRPGTRAVRADDFVLAFKRIADFHITTKLSLSFIEDKIAGIKEYRQATRRYKKGDFSRYDKEDIPGVEALEDEHALQLRLSKPFPQLKYVLAMHEYAPIPRELIAYHLATEAGRGGRRVPLPMPQRDPEIRRREAVVGTGPYLLTEWVRAGKIVLERNPEYRGDSYPTEGAPGDAEAGLLQDAGRPVPFVDVWHLTFVSENNPAWELFKARQRDTGGIPRDVFEDVINPDRQLTDDWAKQGIRLVKSAPPVIYWIAFNMRDRVLGASKSLRQALCLCFDVERQIEVLHNGRGRRARTYIPSTFAGYKQAIGPHFRLDLAAARKKLEQAKAELAAAGVIQPGEPIPRLTLDLGGRTEPSRRFGEFARAEFKKIGVELRIELNDWPTLQQKVNNKTIQMWRIGWHADYPDGENFLQLFYSPNILRGTNDTNYQNPKFDKLYERAAVVMDLAGRAARYVEMLEILNEDVPCLPLHEPFGFDLVHPWVHNVKPHPIPYGFGKYRRIDTDLRRKMGGR